MGASHRVACEVDPGASVSRRRVARQSRAGVPPASLALDEPRFSNPKDECRNPKENRNSNDERAMAGQRGLRHSGFGFLSSFVIGYSTTGSWSQSGHKKAKGGAA